MVPNFHCIKDQNFFCVCVSIWCPSKSSHQTTIPLTFVKRNSNKKFRANTFDWFISLKLFLEIPFSSASNKVVLLFVFRSHCNMADECKHRTNFSLASRKDKQEIHCIRKWLWCEWFFWLPIWSRCLCLKKIRVHVLLVFVVVSFFFLFFVLNVHSTWIIHKILHRISHFFWHVFFVLSPNIFLPFSCLSSLIPPNANITFWNSFKLNCHTTIAATAKS